MLDRSCLRKGFTLTELLVVVVALGILASIAVPAYLGVKQKIYNYGAQASLKLIQAAEKSYRIEARQYIGCVDTAACNAALRLDIAVSGHWQYSVPPAGVNNVAVPPVFCAEANNTTSNLFWHIGQDDPGAVSGACP